jgi:hypothetical protein
MLAPVFVASHLSGVTFCDRYEVYILESGGALGGFPTGERHAPKHAFRELESPLRKSNFFIFAISLSHAYPLSCLPRHPRNA